MSITVFLYDYRVVMQHSESLLCSENFLVRSRHSHIAIRPIVGHIRPSM